MSLCVTDNGSCAAAVIVEDPGVGCKSALETGDGFFYTGLALIEKCFLEAEIDPSS